MEFFKQSLLYTEFKKYLADDTIEYISFDIFDTLLLRYVNDPKDIFDLIGNDSYVRKLFGQPSNFRQLRIAAEKRAREVCITNEICIKDIYRTFTYLTKKQQMKLIKIELQKEQENIFINKEIAYWIKLAIDRGKKILFLSDMYLSKKQILKIGLNKLTSIKEINQILVSSELKYTKKDGSLYTHVLNSLKIRSTQLVHIGDNLYSDVAMANIYKVRTLHYNCNLLYKQQLKQESSYAQITSQQQIARHLSSLNNPYEEYKSKFFFNFGATIAGPIFWAFSQWLLNISQKKEIKQINFILREGSSFKHWFEKIYKESQYLRNIETNMIEVSRKALFLPSLDGKDLDFHKIDFSLFRDLSVEQLYERYGLSSPQSLENYRGTLILELENSVLAQLIKDLEKNKKKIINNHKRELDKFKAYWKSLKIKKKSILFDFGANATMQSHIDKLIDNQFLNVLFYRTKKGFYNSLEQKQATFIDYSSENSRKIELLRRSPDIFEILFNGLLGTTLGYEEKGKKVCAIIDQNSLFNDDSIITAFNKGIKSYIETAKMYQGIVGKWKPSEILSLMTRVIEFPTVDEVNFLGDLPLNTTDDASLHKPLVNNFTMKFVENEGIQEIYKTYKKNIWSHWSNLPWVEGTIMQIDKSFLADQYIESEDKNQKFLKQLLEKIDSEKIESACIYGAGEFFMLLYSELCIRNITINYLVETVPKKSEHMGFPILSPREALERNQNTFIIASGAFSKVMEETLQVEATKYKKSIKHIVRV